MNPVNVHIFSAYSDLIFVDHLDSLCDSLKDVHISYSLGNDSNCNIQRIFSYDNTRRESTIVQSYKTVPNYQRIEDTYFWVKPNFYCIKHENKIIAVQCTKDDEACKKVLGHFILPNFSDNFRTIHGIQQGKNYAYCANRVCLFLK